MKYTINIDKDEFDRIIEATKGDSYNRGCEDLVKALRDLVEYSIVDSCDSFGNIWELRHVVALIKLEKIEVEYLSATLSYKDRLVEEYEKLIPEHEQNRIKNSLSDGEEE